MVYDTLITLGIMLGSDAPIIGKISEIGLSATFLQHW